ncbi:MAG TPA: hypothetical protein ENG21_02245 [Nitrososphaeria archaeon]|nr:hypothetical protein [Nitrososphaeria archaeon]
MPGKSVYQAWWRAYTHPLPNWESEDLEKVREALAAKPLNKSIEHPLIVGFLAGFFQSAGELGYLELKADDNEVYVPYLSVSGEREVVEKFVRLVGDVQEKIESGEIIKVTVTGLRAIIVLRIISSCLLGVKKRVAERMIQYGYKVTGREKLRKLINEMGVREKVEKVQEKPMLIFRIVLARTLNF